MRAFKNNLGDNPSKIFAHALKNDVYSGYI